MSLTLHEEAAKSFDEIADAIRQHVRVGVRRMKPQSSAWKSDIHTVQIDEADLKGPFRFSQRGPKPVIATEESGRARFLSGDRVLELDALCQKMYKAIRPKGVASLDTIGKLAEHWVLEQQASMAFSQFCITELAKKTRIYTVWTPIAELRIQSGFSIGHVEFQTLTSDKLASWWKREGYATLSDSDRRFVDEYFKKQDKELRGWAIAVAKVEAEPTAAVELALEMVDDALCVLQIFGRAAMFPQVRSYCAPRGQENLERYHVILEADGKFVEEKNGFLKFDGYSWAISNEEIQELRAAGMQTIGDLLKAKSHTDFQSRVLTCLRCYAASTRESRLTTRLILMLAALEGLFLKDTTEPIQQNLGERLAFLTKKTAEDRIAVTQLVRRIYSQRSKFVHHAERLELSEDIEEFAKVVWFGLLDVIRSVHVFKTAKDFIDYLDRLKMSGMPFGSNVNVRSSSESSGTFESNTSE